MLSTLSRLAHSQLQSVLPSLPGPPLATRAMSTPPKLGHGAGSSASTASPPRHSRHRTPTSIQSAASIKAGAQAGQRMVHALVALCVPLARQSSAGLQQADVGSPQEAAVVALHDAAVTGALVDCLQRMAEETNSVAGAVAGVAMAVDTISDAIQVLIRAWLLVAAVAPCATVLHKLDFSISGLASMYVDCSSRSAADPLAQAMEEVHLATRRACVVAGVFKPEELTLPPKLLQLLDGDSVDHADGSDVHAAELLVMLWPQGSNAPAWYDCGCSKGFGIVRQCVVVTCVLFPRVPFLHPATQDLACRRRREQAAAPGCLGDVGGSR